MPVGAGIGGSASVDAYTFSSIGGNASIDDSAIALGIGGNASVDVTTAQAWTSREWGRVRVVIDDEDITSLVGDVTWERSADRAGHLAAFTLADERVAYAHATSFSNGSKAVRIYRYTASRAGSDEVLVFQGRTEAPGNSEPILPTGTFSCISDAAAFDEPRACLRYAAFAGKTRAELLDELAASVGLAVTIPTGWGETVVRKPVEYVNVSVFDVARRFCELEGGWPRSTVDGQLEIVPEDEVYGPAIWSFDESNSFTPSEEPPQRPPTRWVLSGTGIASDYSGDETTGAAESIVETVTGTATAETRTVLKDSGSGVNYTYLGARGQVEEIVEEYDTFAVLGTVVNADAFQLKKRTTTLTRFRTYGYQGKGRTSQVLERTTIVEEWFSPLAEKDGNLWTDGSHHFDTEQTFRETQRTVEEWTWIASTDEDRPCELDTKTTLVTGYYAAKDGGITGEWGRAIDGTETYTEDTSKAWDDGNSYSYGLTGTPTMRPTAYSEETWEESAFGGRRTVTQRIEVSGWSETRGEYRGPYDGINNRQYRYGPTEEYDILGTNMKRWIQSAVDGKHVVQTANYDGTYSSEEADGDVPDIPRSDGSTPAYQQDVMTLDATDGDSAYPYLVESETIPEAESVEELEAVWARRMRTARAVRHTIPAPDEKWLNVGSSVAETDAARSMTAWVGPVEQMRVGVDVLSGMGVAEIVVALEEP